MKLVSSQVILITFFVALAAHGAIIVNDTPQGVLTGSSQSQIFLDLDDNTVSDLTFTASRNFRFTVSGPSTTSVLREQSPISGGPIPLQAGFLIGRDNLDPAFRFQSLSLGGGLLSFVFEDETTIFGGPFLGLTAYLGFEFEGEEGSHFGYALIREVGGTGGFIVQTAYETEPGVPISAGAIPEPSSFLLTMASSLLLFRRRR